MKPDRCTVGAQRRCAPTDLLLRQGIPNRNLVCGHLVHSGELGTHLYRVVTGISGKTTGGSRRPLKAYPKHPIVKAGAVREPPIQGVRL